MKSIKKFLFIMVAVAATALAFVSCGNEAQDVVISLDSTVVEHEYYGSVTGTVLSSSSTSVSVYSDDPFATVEYFTGHAIGEETKSNVKNYTVTVPLKVTPIYSGSTSYITYDEINLMKIGDTYYCNKEKVELSGSPEDSEFTIKSVKNGSYVFADLKFTRK